MALFRNLCVDLCDFLCSLLEHASAQSLDLLELAENCSFMNWKHQVASSGFSGWTLSRFRANVVKSYLIGKGLRVEIITSIGTGDKNPLRPNAAVAGRSASRRVEVELFTAKE